MSLLRGEVSAVACFVATLTLILIPSAPSQFLLNYVVLQRRSENSVSDEFLLNPCSYTICEVSADACCVASQNVIFESFCCFYDVSADSCCVAI